MNANKVNTVCTQAKSPRMYGFDIEKKSKYLDIEMVCFLYKGQGSNQDSWNSRQEN